VEDHAFSSDGDASDFTVLIKHHQRHGHPKPFWLEVLAEFFGLNAAAANSIPPFRVDAGRTGQEGKQEHGVGCSPSHFRSILILRGKSHRGEKSHGASIPSWAIINRNIGRGDLRNDFGVMQHRSGLRSTK
jgi:hypothetical protein